MDFLELGVATERDRENSSSSDCTYRQYPPSRLSMRQREIVATLVQGLL